MYENFLKNWINLWVLLFSITVLSYSGHGGQSAIILLLTMLVIVVVKGKDFSRFKFNKEEKMFTYLVLIFFGWQLLGVFYQPAGYEIEDIRAQFKVLDQPVRWVLLLPVFFLLRRYLVDWRLVAVGLGIGTLISVSIAHYQVYYLDIHRAFGTSNHTIPFGELMVVVSLLLWMFVSYAWDKGCKYLSFFLLVASVFAFYGSLLSATRGAWLVYVFMILIWIIHTLKKGLFRKKYLFSTPMLLRVFFAIIVFYAVSQTDQYQIFKSRINITIDNVSSENYNTATGNRVVIYKKSIESIMKHPFGVGTNNFILIDQIGPVYGHAHNEILNLWVENGIQGVLTLLILLGLAFKVFWRNLNHDNNLVGVYAACGLILITSYAIFGLSQSIFSHQQTLIFFIFYLYFFMAQIGFLKSNQDNLKKE